MTRTPRMSIPAPHADPVHFSDEWLRSTARAGAIKGTETKWQRAHRALRACTTRSMSAARGKVDRSVRKRL